jgi:hypothetical protein
MSKVYFLRHACEATTNTEWRSMGLEAQPATGETEAVNKSRRKRDLTTDGKNYLQDIVMNVIRTQQIQQLAIIQPLGACKNNYINIL